MTWQWWCLGLGAEPPCDATGTTQKSAEDHTKATQHGTTGSIRADEWRTR